VQREKGKIILILEIINAQVQDRVEAKESRVKIGKNSFCFRKLGEIEKNFKRA
jgi:hypothetical protein